MPIQYTPVRRYNRNPVSAKPIFLPIDPFFREI